MLHRQEIVENMYVDPSNEQSEMSMSDQKDDVKEATEALKGMLGLGSSAAVVSQPIDSAAPNGESGTPETIDQNKSKRKKRNKKKKTHGGAESTPPRPKPKDTSNPANKQTKQKNKKTSSSQKHTKSQSGNSENFAWSAFQSSPDASKLPIPAFSPTPTSKDTMQEPPDDEDILDLNLIDQKTSSTKPVEQAFPSTKHVEIGDTKSEGTGFNIVTGSQLPTNAPPPGPPFPPSLLQMPPPPPPPPPSFFSPPMSHAYAPPGFVTIRVQLPPVLPANRNLIVANPAGFPVQVHIPEEYAPNQIISVNVPSGPPLPAMPYHHG